MTQKIIREATNKDSLKIQSMIFNIWINEFHFDVKKKEYPDLIDIKAYYSKPDGVFLVALDKQSNMIGTIAYQYLENCSYVLKRMFVKKSHRRKGTAQDLLNELLKVLQEEIHDAESVNLCLSTKENEAIAAKKFYLKNKFKIVNKLEMPNNFPYFYQDDLFMLRKIIIRR